MKKQYLLLPIRPEHVVNILNGKKTIEIRKYIPKCKLPVDVYIYCTKMDKKGLNQLLKNGSLDDNECWFIGKDIKNHNLNDIDFSKTNLNGKVIAKFTLNNVDEYEAEFYRNECFERICLIDRDENPNYITRYCITSYEEEDLDDNKLCKESCLTFDEIKKHVGIGINTFYAWHIDDLVIFDKPKELSEYGVKRAPQKYWYVWVGE